MSYCRHCGTRIGTTATFYCTSCGKPVAAPGRAPQGRAQVAIATSSAIGARMSIGRAADSDLVLSHPSVSWRHALIETVAEHHTIRDTASLHGSYVNAVRVRDAFPLRSGDLIRIGAYELLYTGVALQPFDSQGSYLVEARGLHRTVREHGLVARLREPRKVILHDVAITVRPREFLGIVGGSGQGKSTLLSALSGFTPATSGTVHINGDDLYRNFNAYRGVIGYVPQDDIVHAALPVLNAIRYAARLRVPDANDKELRDRVREVIQHMRLDGREHRRVDKLSGGERKRVNIGCELIGDPGLLYLDEATSGLDPGLERSTMLLLRQLADEGRTVVLVTHATANIAACDKIAFVLEGQLAFHGPPLEALEYFGVNSFADIYTRTSTELPDGADRRRVEVRHPTVTPGAAASTANPWAALFASSKYAAEPPDRPTQRRHFGDVDRDQSMSSARVPFLKQLRTLSGRELTLLRHAPLAAVALSIALPIIGLLLALLSPSTALVGLADTDIAVEIDRQIAAESSGVPDPGTTQAATFIAAGEAQRLLFMLALAATLYGLFAASYAVVNETAIHQRERMAGVSGAPYIASKLTVIAMLAVVPCAVLLLFVAFILRQPEAGLLASTPWPELFFTLFLAAVAGAGAGLLVSAAVRTSDAVIYVLLVVVFAQIVFSGAMMTLPDRASWISRLTTTHWVLNALGSTIDMPALDAQGITCVTAPGVAPPPANEAESRQTRDVCAQTQIALEARSEFAVNYVHERGHLIRVWALLGGFAAAFVALTVAVQTRKDVL